MTTVDTGLPTKNENLMNDQKTELCFLPSILYSNNILNE